MKCRKASWYQRLSQVFWASFINNQAIFINNRQENNRSEQKLKALSRFAIATFMP